MFCSNCGTNLPEVSQFCLKCGQAVTSSTNRPKIGTAPAICSYCSTKLPVNSQFCLNCGQAVPAAANATPPPGATVLDEMPVLAKERPKPRIAIWFLTPVLLLLIWWAAASSSPEAEQFRSVVSRPHTETIVSSAFPVKGRTFSAYRFTVPKDAMNVAVSGQFTATGDTPPNAVEVYVFTDSGFVNWQYGYAPSAFYSSGQLTQGDISATLPDGVGTYYLVFNEKFSSQPVKAVQADVTLHYNRFWPVL